MSEKPKIYRYRVEKEEAEKQGKKQVMYLPGIGALPISVASGDAAEVRFTGRQALALLRILEHNRAVLEKEAQAERDSEFGRGPGAYPAEMPQKIRKGDPRIGKRAISISNAYGRSIEGQVTAILRYRNGSEQIEMTRKIFAVDSDKSGTESAWVHADDVDIL